MSFLAGRLVHGIASAFTSIAALSILAELYSSDLERSKVMGVAMGGVAFGVVGKPFIIKFLKTVIIYYARHAQLDILLKIIDNQKLRYNILCTLCNPRINGLSVEY